MQSCSRSGHASRGTAGHQRPPDPGPSRVDADDTKLADLLPLEAVSDGLWAPVQGHPSCIRVMGVSKQAARVRLGQQDLPTELLHQFLCNIGSRHQNGCSGRRFRKCQTGPAFRIWTT